MKFAYADPPYLGCAKRLYGKHHPEAGIWDKVETHRQLIDRLVSEYPDGWALSMIQKNLHDLLPLVPKSARICAWVKPYCVVYPGVNPRYAWEPVILCGGRKGYECEIVNDWIMANAPVVVPNKEEYVPGQKPRKFCRWIFQLLGAKVGDTLDDLFPGSGAVAAAWAEWIGEKSPLPALPLESFL